MRTPIPLSREAYRTAVFARDGHKCVICGRPGQDAHHIMERRLWPDGGYYLENGATLCAEHHMEAERTTLSCERIRAAAGIQRILLPPHLFEDEAYDKWGNLILPNGQRLRGELADDESVKKVTDGYIDFTHFVKYPRTYHLPWSEELTSDDRQLSDTSCFEGKEVVVTEKMDGENTTMYRDLIHARSIDSGNHPSRNWVKSLWGSLKHEIPEGWRLCGENLYATHSIHYTDLPSYFMLFSVWDDHNVCLSWQETQSWGELLGLWVPIAIWSGPWNEEEIRGLARKLNPDMHEGYMVRSAGSFHYRDFRRNVAKFVRKGHVQTHGNWMRQRIVANELKRESTHTKHR